MECGSLISSSPGKVWLGWGARYWLGAAATNQNLSFYFPDYFLSDQKPWFIHDNFIELETEKLLQMLKKESSESPKFDWTNQGQTIFEQAFNDLQKRFRSGELKKGVPFVFETAKGMPSRSDLIYFLIHALEYTAKHPVFIYGFWDHNNGMLGSTPELLFRQHSNLLETMAVAGTCFKEDSEKIFDDPKIIREHQLVVEGINESMGPFGNISAKPLQLLQLSNICHLVTPLFVKMTQKIKLKSLIKAFHPTPALGAFPKQSGMKWLQDYEKTLPRGRFGAPVGFLPPSGGMTCYVAIRNLQWSEGLMKIGAGCGVVAESVLEKEWQEIKLKIKSIRNIIGA